MSYREALKWISPDCVAFGSGAGSLLNHLAMSLTEKGEAVLIPAPYYAGFDSDMKVRVVISSFSPFRGSLSWLFRCNFRIFIPFHTSYWLGV